MYFPGLLLLGTFVFFYIVSELLRPNKKNPDRVILDVPWATRDKPMMSARAAARIRRSHDRRMAQANDQFEQFRTSRIQAQLNDEKAVPLVKDALSEYLASGKADKAIADVIKRNQTNRNMS